MAASALTTQPAVEPVTLDEVRAHLRIDSTDEDLLLETMIQAARQQAETITRRALVTQTWTMALDKFPSPEMSISSANWYGPQWGTSPGPLSTYVPDGKSGYEIFLPLPPLQSVASIKYVDTDGVQQTLDPSKYKVDKIGEPARIVPAFGAMWPATRNEINAVEVTFTAGFGDPADVPAAIKSWMFMRIGALYENREEIIVGRRLVSIDLPFVNRLLDPYRFRVF